MCVAIKIENVNKSFGETVVLSNVNIEFEKGKVHGLIGRNGSGKTMLMKCICGFVPLSSGQIMINGKTLKKDFDMPKDIGVIIETPGFLPSYNAYKNLKFLADIQGKISKQEIYDAISRVGLDPKSKKHVGKYSLGMRQRLGVAQAILHRPKLLILDEPTNGLDPVGIEELRELIRSFPEKGITVILSSHILSEVQQTADHIGIIAGGVLGYEGKLNANENLEQLFMDVVKSNHREG